MKTPAEIYDALFATDERTWDGHWGQGFVFFLLGAIRSFDLGAGLAAGAFVHREVSGFAKEWRANGLNMAGFRIAVRTKALDGIGDLLFAGFGALTALLWHTAGLWALLGGVFASLAVRTMVTLVAKRRRERG